MIVILEADQMRVNEGVLDVSVAKQLHDVEDVFGPVISVVAFQ
jgi:hypothetical protein